MYFVVFLAKVINRSLGSIHIKYWPLKNDQKMPKDHILHQNENRAQYHPLDKLVSRFRADLAR